MSRVNDFVVRFANVNGTGSASANYLFAKAIFRMGIPVSAKNILMILIEYTHMKVHTAASFKHIWLC